MSSPTPVRDGLRTIWRQPSIFFAELAARWSWGGAALLLVGLALFEYLHTLIVTPTDMFLLRLKHPLAVSRALADIFRGSWPRVLHTLVLLIPALTALWVVLMALGRWVTLRSLLESLKIESPAPSVEEEADPSAFRPLNIRSSSVRSRPLRSLIGLNFLRSGLALAALVSLVGSAIVASLVSTPKHPHVGLAFLFFIPLVIVVSTIWSSVNWFLSIASVFVVRESEDTFGSISAAVNFCRRCAGKVSGAGFWFGAMHLVAFVVASTVVMYPLSLANLVPASVTLSLMGIVTLAYFAVADYLHVARLAGYVSLVEWDRGPKPVIVAPIVEEAIVRKSLALVATASTEHSELDGVAVDAAESVAIESDGREAEPAAKVDAQLPSLVLPVVEVMKLDLASQEDEPLFSSGGQHPAGPDNSPVSGFAPGEPLRPK